MSETPEEVVIPAGALASSAVRVDTWLWATRQLKSRSQATAAVRAGHVRVNGEPVKAAYKVRVGDEVRLRIEGFDRILGVNLLLNKRVSYPQARTAYDDRTPERPACTFPSPCVRRGAGAPRRRSGESWIGCADTTHTSTTKRLREAVAGVGGDVSPTPAGREYTWSRRPEWGDGTSMFDQSAWLTRSGSTS